MKCGVLELYIILGLKCAEWLSYKFAVMCEMTGLCVIYSKCGVGGLYVWRAVWNDKVACLVLSINNVFEINIDETTCMLSCAK